MKKLISLLSAAAIIFSCFTVQLAATFSVTADGQNAKTSHFGHLMIFRAT